MSRRAKWLLVSALSLAAIAVSIWLAAPREPRYSGRPLSDWLSDLSNPHYETQRVARAAIHAMGPAAVPFLTNSLAQRNAISIRAYRKNLIPRRLAAWTHRVVKWHTPMMESRSAAIALQALGADATNAIPSLVAALQDPSWAVTMAAATALGSMGSNAVPALADRLTNGSPQEIPWVLQAVVALGTNAVLLAPQLAKIIETNNSWADYASLCLTQIGAPAVPLVTPVLHGTNDATILRGLNMLVQIGIPSIAATNEFFALMHHNNPLIRLRARHALASTLPPRELAAPHWLEGLHDPDSTNVLTSLQYLTAFPMNVRTYNREIAELTSHPTNAIAATASNTLTIFRSWPK